MELYEYSDDELKKEIRRRAKEKAYKTRMENKFNRYSYWYGVVNKITKAAYSKGIYEIEFKIDGNEDFMKWKRFKLAQGFGFSTKKLPNVGDKVKLRYRNGKGITSGIYNSKIIEIIDK